jgi:glycosyltransferase involved in cell wall biosynthesis
MIPIYILVPAYNCEEFIRDTLISIFNQSFKNFHLVVIDDGSSDNTANIIELEICDRKNVTYIKQSNRGVIFTRNQLLKIAEGNCKYVFWCDADDIYHSDKLKLQYEFLEKNQDYVGCGSWYKKFHSANKTVRKPVDSESLNWLSCFGTPIGFPTLAHRFIKDLTFDESLNSSEDYDFLTRLIEYGKITNLKKTLTMYRVHCAQESTNNKEIQFQEHLAISNRRIRKLLNLHFTNKEIEWLISPKLKDIAFASQVICKLKSIDLEPKPKRSLLSIVDYRVIAFNKSCLLNVIKYFGFSFYRLIFIINLYYRS